MTFQRHVADAVLIFTALTIRIYMQGFRGGIAVLNGRTASFLFELRLSIEVCRIICYYYHERID